LYFHLVGHDLGQRFVPLFERRHRVEAGQHVQLGPFLNGRPFDVGCRWSIAREHTLFEHRHGILATTTGHGKVFPGVTAFAHHVFELCHRFGFTAGGPVVQDFHFAGMQRGACAQRKCSGHGAR